MASATVITISDVAKLKVQDLKSELQLLGLSTVGKKEDLQKRLISHIEAEEALLFNSENVFNEKAADVEVEPISVNGKDTLSTEAPATNDLSEAEKLKLRSQRFGVELSEEAKKKLRAEKFGTNPSPSTQSTLQARAVRFGTTTSTSKINTAEEEEKRLARAARFGAAPALALPPKPSNTEQEKRQARAARFGDTNKTASIKKNLVDEDTAKLRMEKFGVVQPILSEADELKRKRAEKFGIVEPVGNKKKK